MSASALSADQRLAAGFWGGALRVSQVQLLQPFLSMLFAVPLLGERLDLVAAGFALAVVATIFMSRRLARPAAAPRAASRPMEHPR